ncbi:terminase small subunit [Mesorhizobium waimense]|uniref:Terminase small subunit n=2 Tax=Mesorhizobium waimense TaxID=1300307 RepID=A0A3A5L5J2_9HYPH|nr:terminase small subunit [Mesorhizobium waimense]
MLRLRPWAMTPKQEQFVREYLIDLNATQAAIRAGYSAKTAHAQGPRLLENVEVAAAINAAKVERSEETKIDAAWVLKRLADEAVADIADLYDDEGQLLPVHDWPLIWRQGLVQGIEVEELFDGFGKERQRIGTVRKVKLSDRIRRVELIGKHVGVKAFEEQVAITGLDSLADRLARANKRAGSD